MIWRLWVGGWSIVVTSWVLGLILTPLAIWTQHAKLGYTCVYLGAVGLVGLFGMGLWTSDCSYEIKRARPTPRAERKRLREEERRIRFNEEIRRLEREAGLR